jgi:hypothetical protein
MNQSTLTFSYKDSNIFVNELAPYNFNVRYKNVSTTYISFTAEDALNIFIETLQRKGSDLYQLLKGGE